MATTLPTLTQTIDDAFVNTWYAMQNEAIDNILNATVVWAALMGAGCFKPETGGKFLTSTIRHGQSTATGIAKGDTFIASEPLLETMAIWQWKAIGTNVSRSTFDDQKNNGPYKLRDYVGDRLTAARDALEQKYETDILTAFQDSETAYKIIQGLNDMVPPSANRASGTYGGINRPTAYATTAGIEEPSTGNTWWGPKYFPGVLATMATDLKDDMTSLYNAVSNNQSPPNLLITTRTLFELYETYAYDISQIIVDESTRLANLGFEVLRFKGKPLIWTSNMTASNMLMLNTDFIQFRYDPNYWFDMTPFKGEALGLDRAAQILCFGNLTSDQLRRHGRLYYA